jgi:Flp pilus assembly CpaF family ATPase
MIERLPDLVRQERNGMDDGVVLRSIAGAFDLVLQVSKSRNGRRYIAEISNVGGVDAQTGRIILEPVFTANETAQGTTFQHHGVRADTELGRRLTEGGWTSWTK